ncbi:hypothetical protein GCM10008986_24250 [Salinibacillus aidingensis]|uniref:Uncharacterized protein n=1 Tax=Salinibacillus aidingensis TaxID=237684 RepID=A0ABP3LBX4_9BACI
MKEWLGSAAICFNENTEVLMVRSNDSEGWSVPLAKLKKERHLKNAALEK